jgi:hypothetical protein
MGLFQTSFAKIANLSMIVPKWAMRYVGKSILSLFFILILSTASALIFKIDRDSLDIARPQQEHCERPPIQSFWDMYEEHPGGSFPTYDRDLVAVNFGLYAAYAANSYHDLSTAPYRLKADWFGWQLQGVSFDELGGFSARFYTKRSSEFFDVMVVFRGTDGPLNIVDHISNASYFTQMINPWDQYRTARRVFQQIRSAAKLQAGSLKIRYLTVGHSLGGGLARHIAYAFPCTSAITFDSSFVSNEYRLDQPYSVSTDRPQIVDIFEDHDLLSRVSLISNPDGFFRINGSHQWYRMNDNAEKLSQHSISETAAALARIPVVCMTIGEYCAIKLPFRDVRKLYCEAYHPSQHEISILCNLPEKQRPNRR